MSTLEKARAAIVERRLDWSRLDREAALARPDILELLRETCLIESYMPVYTSKLVELFWTELPAIEVLTIECFEAYTHYQVLRRYLEAVGYRPLTDEEVVSLWKEREDDVFSDPIRELVNLMATEQFAANFFTSLLEIVEDPLLRSMLPVFAREEVAHSQLAYELLETRIAADPSIVDHVMKMAVEMRHVGSYVLPGVTPASRDNLNTLIQFSRRVEALTGRPLTSIMLCQLQEARQ